jgi:hypothetical protein
MLPTIALILLSQPATAPNLPAGTSPTVNRAFQAVEAAISKGDMENARKQAEMLPKRTFSIGWNETGVPDVIRDKVEEMRDSAIRAWSSIYGVHISVAVQGDVEVRFVDHCSNGPSGIPAASALEFGTRPRLKVAIGLKRGSALEPIVPADAYTEVAHAIGAYLGVADDPLVGSAMHRDDSPGQRPYGPRASDLYVAETVLATADRLRRDVESGKAVPTGSPSVSLSPAVAAMGDVRQGTHIPLEFKVTNRGSSTLAYRLVPDCGCFSPVAPGGIEPGATATLRTQVNTTEFVGTYHKEVVLFTNDPATPTIEIPVSFTSLPAFRLYRPAGDTVIVPNGGTTVDVLLTLPKDSKMIPERFQLDGMENAKVDMDPWQGVADDPDLDQPAAQRQGYVFHIKVPGQLPVGRTALTLIVNTSDASFSPLRYNLYLQKGIVALPEVVNLADMTTVMRASFRLSRHGKPFQVLKVETGSPNLRATCRPVRGQVEYQVDLLYDGNAPKGDFLAVVKVHTSDPKDAMVEVRVTGMVR